MRRFFSVCFVAGLAAAGCGKSTGSLTGTVTYKGNPVTGGLMLFVDAQGKSFPGSLNPAGNYNCPDLPPGDYIVTINTSLMKPVDPGQSTKEMIAKQGQDQSQTKLPESMTKDLAKVKEMGSKTGQYVAIPDKYANAKTSGLTVKVEAGSQTKDFTLTD